MKICLITSMAGVGGTENASVRYAELLLSNGHAVTLISGLGPLVQKATALGATWIDLDFYGNKPAYALSTLSLARILRRARFDVVHCQMARPVLAAVIANRVARTRSAVVWHSRGLPTATYRRVCPLFTMLGVSAIGNCAHEHHKLIRYGFPQERVSFAYNPLPSLVPSQTRGARSEFVIGSLSRLSAERSVDEALYVLRDLRARGCNASLVVGGDGPQMTELRRLCSDLRLDPYVDFAGRITDLDAFFSRIDVLVNTLHLQGDDGAGVGNNIIEAALFKVPVVAYDSMGISELVLDGDTGFCVRVLDRARFVDCVQQLAQDPVLRSKLGASLKKHVGTVCASERIHADLIASYESAIARERGR